MEDIKLKYANEEDGLLEGLTETEAEELVQLTNRMVHSYTQKEEGVSDEAWLTGALKQELPEKTEAEVSDMAKEIIGSITEFDHNLSDLNRACESGVSREQWFSSKVSEASVGMSVMEYGNYLNSIDLAIAESNAQMIQAVTTQSGEISQNMNLHGFIAEQYHVNTFNIHAALEKAPFRAQVCVPEPGKTYGKNSVDVMIKDIHTGKPVHVYQAKYGKNPKETLRLLKEGNYNNQRWLTPSEQAGAISGAAGGKSVTGYIGGTDRVSVKSDSLTKEQSLKLQEEVQQGGRIPQHDWNVYNTKELALNLGKNAGMAGLQAALLTTGFDMAAKLAQEGRIDTEEAVELALRSGTDAGIKAAVAGALKVGAEKGVIVLLPPGTPAGILANIACVGIENVKILAKAASGEITLSEALDHMGRTSTSMVYGLGWGSAGMLMGAAALSFIPFVGPLVGGVVGGAVGYMAGSKFGQAVYTGVKKVAQAARTVAQKVWSGVKSVGRGIVSGIKSFFRL